MATFLGTIFNETITPFFVSPTVFRIPFFSFPSAAADFINAGAGNDFVNGGGGADTVFGGTGNDTLTGGSGVGAQVFGGDGNDLIFQVNGTPEFIDGGAGIDTLNTTAFGGNYLVNLTTGGTNFAGESFINMENIVAGVGNDTLVGTAGANVMNGGAGNDSMVGLGGNDVMNGGTGNDTLVGGQGRDILTGSTGDDVFDYNLTSESVGFTRDLITSFEFSTAANPADKIDLRTIDANVFLFFDQAFSTIEGNGIGQLSFSNLANGNTLIEGNTDFDAVKELQIEVADGATSAAFWSPSLDFFL